MSVGVTPEQKKILIRMIHEYFPEVQIHFFGSRRSGKHKPSSDLDLCLKADSALDPVRFSKLQAELVESELPFKVDLIDWSLIPDFMRNEILNTSEVWS
jgi:predicted nucleotidyltransferase